MGIGEASGRGGEGTLTGEGVEGGRSGKVVGFNLVH